MDCQYVAKTINKEVFVLITLHKRMNINQGNIIGYSSLVLKSSNAYFSTYHSGESAT